MIEPHEPGAGPSPAPRAGDALAGAPRNVVVRRNVAVAAPARRKLLFLVNTDWFFVSHRLPIAREALRRGWEVHVATPPGDHAAALRAEGFAVHPLALGRSSMNPVAEARAFLGMLDLLKAVRPDVVHLVTPKPVLYGGIAARLAGIRGVVAAVSGLGFVFTARGAKAAAIRFLVRRLYRLALGGPHVQVIVQNPDDREGVARAAALPRERLMLVPGSGVDLAAFAPAPLPPGEPVFVLAARLLRDKGVEEYVAAARALRARGLRARFLVAGEPDPGNPTRVAPAVLEAWRCEGAVELLGHCADVPALFARAHAVVLPSYREGMPKVLLEAAACGRAVITTDVPGCRDAIEPGASGLLVPPRDAGALAAAMERLLRDPALRERMGRAGRALAERRFGIDRVVSAHLDVYRALVPSAAPAAAASRPAAQLH